MTAHPHQPMLDAFGDAAALMLAAATDPEGLRAALSTMTPTELGLLAAAACELGGTLVRREVEAQLPDMTPGPVVDYLTTVRRNASAIGRG